MEFLKQNYLRKTAIFTPVMAGNDTSWQKNITQNRKTFITQSKHIF